MNVELRQLIGLENEDENEVIDEDDEEDNEFGYEGYELLRLDLNFSLFGLLVYL